MLIFICYRRADSRAATRLIFDHLRSALGPKSAYMDVANIPIGGDHRQHIAAVLPSCTLCLAIIGPGWSAHRRPGEVDYVHEELTILQGRGVPILPVLVDGATMPDNSSLPPAVAEVLHIEAARVDSGRDFLTDFERLLQTIRDLHGHRIKLLSFAEDEPPMLPREPLHGSHSPRPWQVPRSFLRFGLAIAALAIVTVGMFSVRALANWVAAPPKPPVSDLEQRGIDSDVLEDNCRGPWSSACLSQQCQGMIDASEQFRFHLAGLYLDAAKDPCRQKPLRDLWLCQGAECLSQEESCSNANGRAGAYTPSSFVVTGRELRDGFSLVVRDGGRTGPILGALTPRYQQRLVKRAFLCDGGGFGKKALGSKAGPIEKLTYYLEPI